MNAIEYTGLSIIGVLLLLAIGLSWINHLRKNKQNKKLLGEFDEFIIQNNLTIDNRQRFNKNIIGIDRLNYVVVFLNNKSKKIHLIRLKDICECRLVKERSRPGGHINGIFLKCNFKQKEKADVIFPFYNEHSDDIFEMMSHSKKAAIWTKRINIFRESAILKEMQLAKCLIACMSINLFL